MKNPVESVTVGSKRRTLAQSAADRPWPGKPGLPSGSVIVCNRMVG